MTDCPTGFHDPVCVTTYSWNLFKKGLSNSFEERIGVLVLSDKQTGKHTLQWYSLNYYIEYALHWKPFCIAIILQVDVQVFKIKSKKASSQKANRKWSCVLKFHRFSFYSRNNKLFNSKCKLLCTVHFPLLCVKFNFTSLDKVV